MSESVAEVLWSMLASAGVKRCDGIVGDALNPVIDALRRDGRVEFIQVRNEEAGVFAAVAEASLTGNLVAVCGTAGPGVMHLLNGIRVADPGEVRDAVAQLLATPGPALLDAVVEPYALSLPPHVSFGEAEGFSLSFAKQALDGNLDDVVQTVKRNVHLL